MLCACLLPSFSGTYAANHGETAQAELTWAAVLHRGCLPVLKWSPIQALTGCNVE